jgi:hypothetical protein
LVNNRKIRLFSGEKVNFVCPSIDVAMNSVISRPDDRIVGVILTGMGKDGVQGLEYIKHLGGGLPLLRMKRQLLSTGCQRQHLKPAVLILCYRLKKYGRNS